MTRGTAPSIRGPIRPWTGAVPTSTSTRLATIPQEETPTVKAIWGGGDTADPDGMGEDAPDVPEGDGTDALPDMSMGDAPTGDAPPGDATDAIEVAETAVYELTFTATWSAETHPTNAPETPHFSGLIGLTHPPGEPFFDLGDTISDGLELVAETGGKELIRPELEAIIEAGDAYRTIDKGGINPTPGQRADVFRASLEHSAVTIVSMLAPSPDWITGVIDLDLRDESGQWRDRVEVDLLVWDAGTDDGLVFATEDIDTSPRQPVQLLTSDSADTDFVAGAPSVGSFVFVLRVE